MKRCAWSESEEIYIQYHDQEWGVPNYDDRHFFEMLILEGAQAGLSWITVLKKRENYRKAFDHFDPIKVTNYDEKKIEELLSNPGIIRNRLKIRSTVQNAKAFLRIQEEFGSFSNYIWGYVNNKPIINHWENLSELPARTELSDRISKDLKKRGFNFVGTTIIYSFLQATGLVMDHIKSCFRYEELKK